MAQQFIQRVAQWIANEVIQKRLANSRLFIDAAHAVHTHVQKTQKIAAEAGERAAQKVAASPAAAKPANTLSELFKNISKAAPPPPPPPTASRFAPGQRAAPPPKR